VSARDLILYSQRNTSARRFRKSSCSSQTGSEWCSHSACGCDLGTRQSLAITSRRAAFYRSISTPPELAAFSQGQLSDLLPERTLQVVQQMDSRHPHLVLLESQQCLWSCLRGRRKRLAGPALGDALHVRMPTSTGGETLVLLPLVCEDPANSALEVNPARVQFALPMMSFPLLALVKSIACCGTRRAQQSGAAVPQVGSPRAVARGATIAFS